MPARSVYLVTVSLSEAEPGRFGGQVSITDIYHAMPCQFVHFVHPLPLRWARPLRRTMPKPSQGPPSRGALAGEVNLSVPVAQAGMYDDACIIHAEQIVAAA